MQDEKVTSRTIDYFSEALPGQNKFIILLPSTNYQCVYLKRTGDDIYKVVYGTKSFWQAVGEVSQYKYIILHFLNADRIRFVNKISHPGIVWVIWGADLYFGLLSNRGYNMFADPKDEKETLKTLGIFKQWMAKCRKAIVDRWRIKAVLKISYVCGDQGDYDLLLHYYPEFSHLRRKEFFYYPVDDIMRNIKTDTELGNDIIVGNSASTTGNHREAFKLLSEAEIGNRKVIVPVSYGINKKRVMEAGKELLPDNFLPVEEFLSLDKYNELLLSARSFVYANYRQEATGNIVIALYLGAVVFLSDNNPSLKSMRDLGFIVFSIGQLKEKIDYRLTSVEKKHNIELVNKLYSRNRLLSVIKESFG